MTKVSIKRGRFVTIEGGEGSGKSTLIKEIGSYFSAMGEKVLIIREPGGLPAGEKIRDILVSEEVDVLTEAMLFASSRNELVKKVINPALEEGTLVICDRFIDSNLVYQGYVKGLGIDKVLELNEPVLNGLMPDLTLYLDLDPKVGLERISQNNRETNRFDKLNITFHEKVRKGFQHLANHKDHKSRIKTIDASQSTDAICLESLAEIVKRFGQKVA